MPTAIQLRTQPNVPLKIEESIAAPNRATVQTTFSFLNLHKIFYFLLNINLVINYVH